MDIKLKTFIDNTIYVPKENDMMVEGFIIQSPFDDTHSIIRWFIRDDIDNIIELSKTFCEDTGALVNISSSSIAKTKHLKNGVALFHTEFTIPFITIINIDDNDKDFLNYISNKYYHIFSIYNREDYNEMRMRVGQCTVDESLSFETFLKDMKNLSRFIYKIKLKPCNQNCKTKLKLYLSLSQGIHDKLTSSLSYHELRYCNILKHKITENGIVLKLKLPKSFTDAYIRDRLCNIMNVKQINRAEIYK